MNFSTSIFQRHLSTNMISYFRKYFYFMLKHSSLEKQILSIPRSGVETYKKYTHAHINFYAYGYKSNVKTVSAQKASFNSKDIFPFHSKNYYLIKIIQSVPGSRSLICR